VRARAFAFLVVMVVAGWTFVSIAGPAVPNGFVDFKAELTKAALLSLSGLALTFPLFRLLFNRFGIR
jgi:hypothetical protein